MIFESGDKVCFRQHALLEDISICLPEAVAWPLIALVSCDLHNMNNDLLVEIIEDANGKALSRFITIVKPSEVIRINSTTPPTPPRPRLLKVLAPNFSPSRKRAA